MDERITLGPNTGESGGCYEIFLDDAKVGMVRKYRKTYNLRRYIVDEGWDLFLDDHEPQRGFRLRRHAVEAARKVLLP